MRPDVRTYEEFMRDAEGDYEELEANQSVLHHAVPQQLTAAADSYNVCWAFSLMSAY
jgi:hypothetical protein